MTSDDFKRIAEKRIKIDSEASLARHYRAYVRGQYTAEEYIARNTPAPNSVSIWQTLEKVKPVSENEVNKAVRWCESQNFRVQDSIAGPYVSTMDAAALERFLQQAIPMGGEYEKAAKKAHLEWSVGEYNRFLSFAKSKRCTLRTAHHPFNTERYYWIGSRDALHETLAEWFALMNSDTAADDCVSLSDAAKRCGIPQKGMLEWLKRHPEKMVPFQSAIMVPQRELAQLLEEWANACELGALTMSICKDFPKKFRNQALAAATEAAAESGLLLERDAFPQMNPERQYYFKHSETALTDYMEEALRDIMAVNATALPCRQARELVRSGAVAGEMVGNAAFVSRRTADKIIQLYDEYTTLDAIVDGIVKGSASDFSSANKTHRDKLVEFVRGNEWWKIKAVSSDDFPEMPSKFGYLVAMRDKEELEKHIVLWLRAFGKSEAEKMELLLAAHEERYPKSCDLIRSFYRDRDKAIGKADIDMVDFLFSLLSKELTDMTTEELLSEVITPYTESTIASGNRLSDLLEYCGNSAILKVKYAATGYHKDVSAYQIKEFAVIVACVVNPEIWKEKNLVEKALHNADFADLWLFTALHIFAAWRKTDYIRLAAPTLTIDNPGQLLAKIGDGSFTDDQASFLAREYIAEIKAKGMTPHKTEGTAGVSNLFLSCPESCLPQFGRIVAIATAHYREKRNGSSQFVRPEVNTAKNIRSFYGDEFLVACGGKSLKTVKATKALLQSIEVVVREDFHFDSKLAYHIASVVRSHKGTLQKLSQTTEIYLRDSEFYGLSPEYVLFQMFERGVCSFIVESLLKKCYGDLFIQLPIESKTEAIQAIGLMPYQTDELRRMAEKSMLRAQDTVEDLVRTGGDCEKAIFNIAMGNCEEKNGGGYCLCVALGAGCLCRNRVNCVGCKYEILTKASLIHYTAEYTRLEANNVSALEKKRNLYLQDKIISPCIVEIMQTMRKQATLEEQSVFKKLGKAIRENGKKELSAGHDGA